MKHIPLLLLNLGLGGGTLLAQTDASAGSDEFLPPRKIIFKTGPEVHYVVVFDTLPRVDPDEVNYRILYDEKHTPDMGVISFNGPSTFWVIGFDLNNKPVTNLQYIQNHASFPIHLLPPIKPKL